MRDYQFSHMLSYPRLTYIWVHIAISKAKRLPPDVHHKIKGRYLQLYFDKFCCKFNQRYLMFDKVSLSTISYNTVFGLKTHRRTSLWIIIFQNIQVYVRTRSDCFVLDAEHGMKKPCRSSYSKTSPEECPMLLRLRRTERKLTLDIFLTLKLRSAIYYISAQ